MPRPPVSMMVTVSPTLKVESELITFVMLTNRSPPVKASTEADALHVGHVPLVERLVEGFCVFKHTSHIRHFRYVPIAERLIKEMFGTLTMSPTPSVVSSKSRASTSGLSAPDSTSSVSVRIDEDLARRRFRHRGVVDHRQHVWRRRVAVLVLDCGLHRPAKMSGPQNLGQNWGQKIS